MLYLGLLVGLLLQATYLLSQSLFRIDEGTSGLLTSFGAIEHAPQSDRKSPDAGEARIYPPGLHRKWPWQKVHRVSRREQNLTLSSEEGSRTAIAEDGTVLRFESILRYSPVTSQLERYLFGLRRPTDHISGLFTSLLRNEIANFRPQDDSLVATSNDSKAAVLQKAGSYAVIRRERQQLNARIGEFCRTQIGDRYGVQFHAVDLTDILPPDELADALNAVMRARTEADFLYARAEAECSQRVIAATQGIAIATQRASAIEVEMTQLASFLRELHHHHTLSPYLERRRNEVLAESRTLYIKRPV